MAEVRKIELKQYNLTELAEIYGVCTKTIKKWIKPHEEIVGQKNGRYYMIPQVRCIFKLLGLPSMVVLEDIQDLGGSETNN